MSDARPTGPVPAVAPGVARLGWRGRVGALLPPALSLPARALLGNSREPELKVLRTYVREGDTVVDVGAHKGVYTFWLRRLVGRSGTVLAYEPQPAMHDYLRTALGGRRYRNVVISNVALSDHAGAERLTIPVVEGSEQIAWASLEPDGGAGVQVEVPTTTLDQQVAGRSVSFVKCDVEGHELSVLKGSQDLLCSRRAVWLVEIEKRHAADRVTATLDVFTSAGYEPYYLDAAVSLRPVPQENRTADGLNQVEAGHYVNNFFFLPR